MEVFFKDLDFLKDEIVKIVNDDKEEKEVEDQDIVESLAEFLQGELFLMESQLDRVYRQTVERSCTQQTSGTVRW